MNNFGFNRFGFEVDQINQGGGGGGNFSGTILFKPNQVPTTFNYVNWNLPTSTPIVPGSLSVYINGLLQSASDFSETVNGLGFTWIDTVSIYSDDYVSTSFLLGN